MNNIFIEKIVQSNHIAIFGHINPDGDCIGSCLGLCNYILDNYENKYVDVFLQEVPQKFKFLHGVEHVITEKTDKVYDLAISLDCGDRDRHGIFFDIYGNANYKICLDHHRSNMGFGDFYYCDPDASSTAEVLFRFLDENRIGKWTAECIYLGIVHDTGVFKYSSTTQETMEIAGKMLTKGVKSQEIIDNTFYKVSYNQNKLAANVILESKLYFDGKVISGLIDTEMFQKHNCTKEDTDGIVDKLRITDGVEVAIFIYQKGEDWYKFSLRSVNYVDVSKISVAMGGGGHIRAAGFDAKGNIDEILNSILSMIEEQL